MNFRATVIIGILLVVIGAYAYFIEYKGGEKKKEQEEQSKTLLEVKKENVGYLKLESAGQTIEIHPSGKDAWAITSPLKTRADESTVGSLLSDLEKVKYKDIVEEKPGNLSQYELDHPKNVIRIGLKGGGEKVLKFGAKNPVSNVHYAQVQGDPRVYALETTLADPAGKSLFDFRDKKLTDFSTDKIETLGVHTAKLDIQLKKDSGAWKMVQPVSSPASDSQINSLLSSLEYLRATSFEDHPSPDLKTYGLDSPSATVELTLEKGLRQKILFGTKAGSDIYCMVEGNPAIAKVNDAFSPEFDKPLESWREKKLAVFNRFDVEELQVKSGGKEYLLKKGKEEKWTALSPSRGELPDESVQSVMEKLENAEIDHYGDASALPGAPQCEINMTLKDWQNNVTKKHLAFGPVEGNLQAVKNDDYSTIVFTNGAIQIEIMKALADLKPAPPQKPPK